MGGAQVLLQLVGDGNSYYVDMPVFGQNYSGTYGTPLKQGYGRIHFMPDDVIAALDLTNLFYGKAQMVKHGAVISQIESLELVTGPNSRLRPINSVTVDRRSKRLLFMELYDPDGSSRVQIMFGALTPIKGPRGPVEIPHRIEFFYPWEQTHVLLGLSDVRVDVEIPPGTFRVTR